MRRLIQVSMALSIAALVFVALVVACSPHGEGGLIMRGGNSVLLGATENPYYEIKWADGSVEFYSAVRYECRFWQDARSLITVSCWWRQGEADVVYGSAYYLKVRSGPE